jgi:uncharacterized protein YceK
MKNIIKKIIMLTVLVIVVVFIAGCSTTTTSTPTTTTEAPTTTTEVPTTTITVPERVWGPADVSVKMITKEMGCDDMGGFYTLFPELTIYSDFPAKAASITFTMTGGDFPEIHTLELKADGSYKYSDILDYADTCDVVFQAEVTAVIIH